MSGLWHLMMWVLLPASIALCIAVYRDMRRVG
jgi:hypothetical protein